MRKLVVLHTKNCPFPLTMAMVIMLTVVRLSLMKMPKWQMPKCSSQ